MAKKGSNRKNQHAGETDDGYVDPSRTDQVDGSDVAPREIDLSQQGGKHADKEGRPGSDTDDPGAPGSVSDPDDVRDDPPRREEPEIRERVEAAPERRPTSEDDDETYSRRVRTRINRERELRRRTEGTLKEVTAQNKELADRLARIERAQDENTSKATLATVVSKIDGLKKDLQAAIADGDTAKQLDINIQLSEAISSKTMLERDIQTAKGSRERQEQQARETGKQPSGKPETPPTVEEFLAANTAWFEKRGYEEESELLAAEDKIILRKIRAGDLDFEPYSEEHIEHLAKRMKARFPELEVKLADGTDIEEDELEDKDVPNDRDRRPTNGKRPPVGGMGGRDGRRGQSEVEMARQGKVRLDDNDYRQMRVFGLDPNNKEHRVRFATERRRTILGREGARR